MSRRRKNPPPDALKRIKEYTLKNYGVDAMTQLFGVSREVFYRWLKENPELDEARQVCLGIKEKENTDRLEENAKKGNVAAQIFLAKARFHWRENAPVADQQNVQINISLPGSMRLAEYKAQIATAHSELVKQIEHEEQDDGIRVDRA